MSDDLTIHDPPSTINAVAQLPRDASILIRRCELELDRLEKLSGQINVAIDQLAAAAIDPRERRRAVLRLRRMRRDAFYAANRVGLCRSALIEVRRQTEEAGQT